MITLVRCKRVAMMLGQLRVCSQKTKKGESWPARFPGTYTCPGLLLRLFGTLNSARSC